MAEEGTQTEVPKKPALVGDCPVVEVMVQGRLIPCILDTGSQVTLFSKALFQRHFQDEPVMGASEISWLSLRAANVLQLPYVGYALLDFEVGGVSVPSKGVLIVEDRFMPPSHAILGMNVINQCWEALFQGAHPGWAVFKAGIPKQAGAVWQQAFTTCRRVQLEGTREEFQATARLQAAVTLDPQSETLVWAQVQQAAGGPDRQVMVEDYQDNGHEWLVARAVLQMRAGRVPLRVCNPQPYSVELPPRRPLAKVTCVDPQDIQAQSELVLRRTGDDEVEVDVCAVSAGPKDDLWPLSFQGEGLTTQQQARVDDLLQRWSGVFAEHKEDYGRTTAEIGRAHV